jgi:hypothetical protein
VGHFLRAVCRVIVLNAALGATFPNAAAADPLALDTANFILENDCCGTTGWSAGLSFFTANNEFFLASSILDPVLAFSPVPADQSSFGEAVDLSRRFYTVGAQPGFRQVPGGVPGELEPVFFTADFQTVAPDLTVGVTRFVPYVWSGLLTIARDPALSDVLFSGALTGTGEATMFFVSLPGPGATVGVTQIVYGGDHAAPVPEPSTALLLGFGLVALGARHWRQRKAR